MKACFTRSGIALIRHEDAPLGGEFGEQARIAGIDPAHDRRLVVPQAIDVRQIGAEALDTRM